MVCRTSLIAGRQPLLLVVRSAVPHTPALECAECRNISQRSVWLIVSNDYSEVISSLFHSQVNYREESGRCAV
ncbi:hypothetical protein SAMN05444165_7194 [Paraburkholderia phenazinium]|jgi:hypothetical protein|uniref:Uncharacterized protein n=1 Tax=Paraburkholderia phenazinium TaxID=60549 RepID=A0A1N6LGN0_9BURK|nr:hypothetical protein SAMN05444165_7194 [Paraburkholderia phenazinium]